MKVSLGSDSHPSGKGKKTAKDTKLDRTELMQQELDDLKTASGDFYQWKEGKNMIRILPPVEGTKLWYSRGHYHYRIGPESRTIACPNKINGDKCPICEKAEDMKNKGTERSKKIAKHLYPKIRIFANGYVIGTGTRVLAFGRKVFESLLGYFVDPEWDDLDDIVKGRNINIHREGSGLNTKYEIRPNPKARPLEDMVDDVDAILDARKDLRDYTECLPYEDIEELLEATDLDALTKSNKPEKQD